MSEMPAKEPEWSSYSYLQDPAKLHDVWPDVAPDITECMLQETSDVWLNDVYTSLRTGASLLLVCRHRNTHEYAGMAVLVEHLDPYNGTAKTLHIWFANTANQFVTGEGLANVEAIARARGCGVLTLRGSSPAFTRWGGPKGFKFGHVELSKEV
tara:strand:+ start:225 stop:686 length:462 start_codon:yes stop_codon:yes gene_type:complete